MYESFRKLNAISDITKKKKRGSPAEPGEIREWSDGWYQKQENGDWDMLKRKADRTPRQKPTESEVSDTAKKWVSRELEAMKVDRQYTNQDLARALRHQRLSAIPWDDLSEPDLAYMMLEFQEAGHDEGEKRALRQILENHARVVSATEQEREEQGSVSVPSENEDAFTMSAFMDAFSDKQKKDARAVAKFVANDFLKQYRSMQPEQKKRFLRDTKQSYKLALLGPSNKATASDVLKAHYTGKMLKLAGFKRLGGRIMAYAEEAAQDKMDDIMGEEPVEDSEKPEETGEEFWQFPDGFFDVASLFREGVMDGKMDIAQVGDPDNPSYDISFPGLGVTFNRTAGGLWKVPEGLSKKLEKMAPGLHGVIKTIADRAQSHAENKVDNDFGEEYQREVGKSIVDEFKHELKRSPESALALITAMMANTPYFVGEHGHVGMNRGLFSEMDAGIKELLDDFLGFDADDDVEPEAAVPEQPEPSEPSEPPKSEAFDLYGSLSTGVVEGLLDMGVGLLRYNPQDLPKGRTDSLVLNNDLGDAEYRERFNTKIFANGSEFEYLMSPPRDSVNPCFFVEQDDEHKGVFKSDVGAAPVGNFRFRKFDNDVSQSSRELAAYQLDSMLGFGVVPATKYGTYDLGPAGKKLWRNYAHRISEGEENLNMVPGVIQERAENVFDLIDYSEYAAENETGITDMEDVMDSLDQNSVRAVAVLDYLIGNTDRHAGNLLINRDTKAVIAIDHGLAFPDVPYPRGVRSWPYAYLDKKNDLSVPQEILDRLATIKKDDVVNMMYNVGFGMRPDNVPEADVVMEKIEGLLETGELPAFEGGV